jgi:hypothetical protein
MQHTHHAATPVALHDAGCFSIFIKVDSARGNWGPEAEQINEMVLRIQRGCAATVNFSTAKSRTQTGELA